nr:MAG: replication associated protein [Cressdnaviricota sp.]
MSSFSSINKLNSLNFRKLIPFKGKKKHGHNGMFKQGFYAAGTIFKKQLRSNFSWQTFFIDHKEDISYMLVSGAELTKEEEIHYHVYLQFHKKLKLRTLQNMFNDKHDTHFEKVIDTNKYCQYCRKEKTRISGEKPQTFGVYREPNAHPKHTPLQRVYDSIQNGLKLEQIKMKHGGQYIQYISNIKKVLYEKVDQDCPDFTMMDVCLYYGDPGIGKSSECIAMCKLLGLSYYIVQPPTDRCGKMWFDGYIDQQALIFNDVCGQVSIVAFFNLLDGYKKKLEIKGGFVAGVYTHVFLTSNCELKCWYPKTFAKDITMIEALDRRINRIVKMTHCNGIEIIKNLPPGLLKVIKPQDIFHQQLVISDSDSDVDCPDSPDVDVTIDSSEEEIDEDAEVSIKNEKKSKSYDEETKNILAEEHEKYLGDAEDEVFFKKVDEVDKFIDNCKPKEKEFEEGNVGNLIFNKSVDIISGAHIKNAIENDDVDFGESTPMFIPKERIKSIFDKFVPPKKTQ